MARCGLLGRKLGHSYSPVLHGLLADYPYTLFEKEPEEVEDFVLQGDWTGINVGIPYKKTVIPYCTELSPLARRVGSVNTLVRLPDGGIYGDNTDYFGFEQIVLRLGVDCRGKKALVLGSGGASVTAQAVLRAMGAEVTVISRSGADNYTNLERHADARIIANGTPVGMYPENGVAPVDLTRFPKLEAVLDAVYNPVRTALMLQAEELGIPHESGLLMLAAQAVRSSEQFCGRQFSPDTPERVWRRLRALTENLILIGMPGCGKTTVGRLLAEQTGRDFYDTDALLAERLGMAAGEFITAHGEAAFRTEETKLLAELGKQRGAVIATGGGCVTRPENYPLLHQNGEICLLLRALDALPTEGRPLSEMGGVQKLWAEREALYRRFADRSFENRGTPDETAAAIAREAFL